MKRICFLMDSIFSIGGVQRVTAVVAKALASEYDVTIVSFDSPDTKDLSMYGLGEAPISFRFFSYPQAVGLKQKLCKAYSGFYRKMQPHGRWFSSLYARSSFPSKLRHALLRELQQGQYDTIIGVHATLAARLATMKAKLRGVRCIGWIHNSFEALFSPTSLYIGPTLQRHYVYQFQKLDATVVLCRHDAESYIESKPSLSPTVIYNPLTLQPGMPAKGTSKRFLAVGRFSHRHKGFDLLIDAFSIFAKSNTEWKLDIVGEGPEQEMYEKKIAGYGLQERIVLHPFTRQIQDYYSGAQVYVLSSRWEGFGLVLVEAMAHGLPVVSSNLPTSVEILGDFALYFENGDTHSLAQRLLDATRLDWSAKSAEAFTIAARFDPDAIVTQWKQLL